MAQEILDTPQCQRDRFAAKLLQVYNSIKLLQGEKCRQALVAAAAALLRCTTLSTERAHSRNSRRAAQRVQTAQLDVASMALHRASQAGFRWWKPKNAQNRKKRKGCHAVVEGEAVAPGSLIGKKMAEEVANAKRNQLMHQDVVEEEEALGEPFCMVERKGCA